PGLLAADRERRQRLRGRLSVDKGRRRQQRQRRGGEQAAEPHGHPRYLRLSSPPPGRQAALAVRLSGRHAVQAVREPVKNSRFFTASSGQFSARFELAGGSVRQLSRVQVDVDFPAVQVPSDELFGERILDVALNG